MAATHPKTASAAANQASEVACVLIPLHDGQLLLPSVCIAEITPWRRIKPVEGAPDWCIGVLGWRGVAVPVIRFERLNQPRTPWPARGRCLVVMNRTGVAAGASFYALAVEGLPRLVQLAEGDLVNDDRRLGRAESRALRVGTETASIPSLEYLEQQVAGLRSPR